MTQSIYPEFVILSEDLEGAGLVWQPGIGDEVSARSHREIISILVDPQGMTPSELRSTFIWLPTVEQLVEQVEARQGILQHLGIELSGEEICYRTVLRATAREIESRAESLRLSLGMAVRDMLTSKSVLFFQ